MRPIPEQAVRFIKCLFRFRHQLVSFIQMQRATFRLWTMLQADIHGVAIQQRLKQSIPIPHHVILERANVDAIEGVDLD
jgi:hypothetical protein